MTKAQLAIIEAVVVVSIFIVLIVSIVLIWNNYSLRLDEKVDINKIQIRTFQIMDSLIKTSGIPTGWETNSSKVEQIGLATEDRILSTKKVEAFTNLSYNKTREILNIEYDFYFKLTNSTNDTLKEFGTIPKNNIISLQRKVLYQNDETTVQFALWK